MITKKSNNVAKNETLMAKNLFLEENEDHLKIFPKTVVKRDALGFGDAMSLIHRCNGVLQPRPPPVIHSTVSKETFEGLSLQDLKTDTMAWLSRQRQFKPIEPTSKSTNIDIQNMLLRASRVQVGLQRERNSIDYDNRRNLVEHPAYRKTYEEMQTISNNLEQNREKPFTLSKAIGDLTGAISGIINKVTPVVSGLGLQSIFFSYFVTNYVGLTAFESIAAAVAVNIVFDLPKSYRAEGQKERHEGEQGVLLKLYQAMLRSTTTTLCVTSVYQVAGLVFTGGYLIVASAVIPVIGRLLFSNEYKLNQVKTAMEEARDEEQLREEALESKKMELFFFQHGGRAQSAFAQEMGKLFGFAQNIKVYLAAIPFIPYKILYEQFEPFRLSMDGLKVAVNYYAKVRDIGAIYNPLSTYKKIFDYFYKILANTISGFVNNYFKRFQSEEEVVEVLQEIQPEIEAFGGKSLFRKLITAGKGMLVYCKNIVVTTTRYPFTTLLSLGLGIFFTDYLFSFSPESYGVLNYIVEGRTMLMGSVYSALHWTLGASDKSNLATLLSRVSRGALSLLCFTSLVHGIENSAEYMYGVYEKLVNQTIWCQALCVGVMAAIVGCLNYNEIVLQGVVPLFTSAIYFIKNYYMVLVPGATVDLLQCCVNYLTYVASSPEALQFIYNCTLTVISGGIMGVLRNHMGVYMTFMLPLIGTLFVNDMTGLELDAWKVMCVALFSGITTLGVVRWGGSTRFGIKVGQCVEILQEASLSKIFEEQSLYFKLHVFDSDLLETTFSSMLRFLYLEVYTKQKVDMIVRETAELVQQPELYNWGSREVKDKLIKDDKKIIRNKINEIYELLTQLSHPYGEVEEEVNAMYVAMQYKKIEILKNMHNEFKTLVEDNANIEDKFFSRITGTLNQVMNEVAFWKPETPTINVDITDYVVEKLDLILEDSANNLSETYSLMTRLNKKTNYYIEKTKRNEFVSPNEYKNLSQAINIVEELIESKKEILESNDKQINYLQTKIYNDLVARAPGLKDTMNVRKKFRENFVPNSILGMLKNNVKLIRDKLGVLSEEKKIVGEIDEKAKETEALNNFIESSNSALFLLTENNVVVEKTRLLNWEKKLLDFVAIRTKQIGQQAELQAELQEELQEEKQEELQEEKQAERPAERPVELPAKLPAQRPAERVVVLPVSKVVQEAGQPTLVEIATGAMKGNYNVQKKRLMLFSKQIESKATSTSTAWKTMTGFGGEEGEQGSPKDREGKFISTLGDDLPDRPEGAPETLKEGMLAFYNIKGNLKNRLSNIIREGNFFEKSTGLRDIPEIKDVYYQWLEKIDEKEEQGLLPVSAAEALRKNLTFMGYDRDIKEKLEAIQLTPEKLRIIYPRKEQQKNIMREMNKEQNRNAADPLFLWSISEERAPPHILDAKDPFQGVRSRLIDRVNDLLGEGEGEYKRMEETITHNIKELKSVVDQVIENPQLEVRADYIHSPKQEEKALFVETSNALRLSTYTEMMFSVSSLITSQVSGIASTISSNVAHSYYKEGVKTLGYIGDTIMITGAREIQIPVVCEQASMGPEAWNAPEVQRGCTIIANQQQELLELRSSLIEVEVQEPLNVLTGESFAGYVVGKLYDYNPDIDNRYMPKKDWVILDNFQFNKDDSLIEEFYRNFETTDDFKFQYAKKSMV